MMTLIDGMGDENFLVYQDDERKYLAKIVVDLGNLE